MLPPPQQEQRVFLPQEFKITVWSKLKPYYNDLLKRPLHNQKDLKKWLLDKHELNHIVFTEVALRERAHQEQPEDGRLESYYDYILREILPKIADFEQALSEKGQQLPKRLKSSDLEPISLGVFQRFKNLLSQ